MKNTVVFGLAALLVSTSPMVAMASATVPESASCVISKTDPYEPGAIMHEGFYKGQCMDNSEKRPAMILSEDDNEIVIANFYHKKHFWIAHIPKAGVDQVIFQIAHFPESVPIIHFAHTQLRLKFQPGIFVQLESQDPSDHLQPEQISDLAIVDTFIGPKGVEYNAMKGFKPTYGNVLRIMGALDRAHEELGGNDDITRQILLKMKQEEKDKLLVAGIRKSDSLALNDVYKLLANNCTTISFDLLDEAIQYPKKIHKFKMNITHVHDPIEGPSMKALKKRKIIDKEIQTWNEETGLK